MKSKIENVESVLHFLDLLSSERLLSSEKLLSSESCWFESV